MSSVLNCRCQCVGACLRRKVDQLNTLLRSVSIPIVFPDAGNVPVIITGVDIPAGKLLYAIDNSHLSFIHY